VPRINPINPSLYVSATGQVAINKTTIFPPDYPLTSADGKDWFSNGEVISLAYSVNGQGFLKGRRIVAFTIDTFGNYMELGEWFGVNGYAGGGNRWAIFAYDFPGGPGYTVLDGIRYDSIIPVTLGYGYFAYVTQPTTYGLCICKGTPNPDKDEIEPPNVNCQNIQLHENGAVTYSVGSEIRQRGLNWPDSIRTTVNSFGQLRAFKWHNEWWILYQENVGLGRSLLHPINKLEGYIFRTNGADCNRPDAAEQTDSSLLVVYSKTHDVEGVEDIETTPFNFTDARTNFEPSQPGDNMIPAFERPMWQAPFHSHHTRYGDTEPSKHVGNAIYVDYDDAEPARFALLGYPLIINTKLPNPEQHPNLNIAWFVSAGSMQELAAAVVDVERHYSEKPIIAYLDSRSWIPGTPDWITNNVWPAIQAYRSADETLDSFNSKINHVIDIVSKYNQPMCLVTRFDDFNGSTSIEKTLECMLLYEKWLRDYNFVAHMPFADRRGNGISKNESLWKWARTFQYAIPSGRPNRFDYWRPKNSSIKDILKNKLGQSRSAVVLEKYLRDDILNQYNNEPIKLDESLLRQITKDIWIKHDGQNSGVILNEIAYVYNQEVNKEFLGLSYKPGGFNAEQPHTGKKIASDIVQEKPKSGEIFSTMYDVLSDNGPMFKVSDPHNNPDRIWLPAVTP